MEQPMKRILALLLLAFPTQAMAYEERLPRGSLLCGEKSELNEAVRAIEHADDQWFNSLPLCLQTNQDLKAQRIDCEDRICKVRFWLSSGQSAVGYTLRAGLKH
jgi:hypothetical protein